MDVGHSRQQKTDGADDGMQQDMQLDTDVGHRMQQDMGCSRTQHQEQGHCVSQAGQSWVAAGAKRDLQGPCRALTQLQWVPAGHGMQQDMGCWRTWDTAGHETQQDLGHSRTGTQQAMG